MWHPDDFLARLYEETRERRELEAMGESAQARQARIRRRLAGALALDAGTGTESVPSFGPFVGAPAGSLADSPPPPMNPRLLERTECAGYVRERIELTTAEGLRMPVYVLVPTGRTGPHPIAIACHGHGSGSREAIGLAPDGSELGENAGRHGRFASELALRGFAVAVPELLGFGDRRLLEDAEAGPETYSCYRLAVHLLMHGRTLAGVRIAETLRAVDYMAARPDCDAARIGAMGYSGGGLVAGFAAALDGRIGATALCGYANLFRDSVLASAHCLDNYVPGLLEAGELPDLLGLIAPRPLLLSSGTTDPLFPIESVRAAHSRLRDLYTEALGGMATLPELEVFEGGHEVNGARAYEWLQAWAGLNG
ncbi:alpha/beta hydrolase family protein [Cohnella thailandensis]|uniref:Dienelactone hydrolase n=1 Tax=Cohnella thailandensis TaxID=557557 RepID=A0A841SSV0_9BACL|nr:dienelactone hydrolase [Cohnella thailandensis]MBB6635014.1 dienelactone hydrolase [Cohnella thailandensis]MBP1975762.1 dienelactone hydrolase [Cohnella thailandensis]